MSDAIYNVRNGTPFAMTTGAKTVLNIIAGANQPVSLIAFTISFDGVTASAVPATVDVCQSTQAGAGTAGVTPTVVQTAGRTILAQVTAGANYTAEPTTLTAIETFYVPQFMGLYSYQYPLGQEPDSDLSGGTVKAIAIRANVTANVNCLVTARFGIGG